MENQHQKVVTAPAVSIERKKASELDDDACIVSLSKCNNLPIWRKVYTYILDSHSPKSQTHHHHSVRTPTSTTFYWWTSFSSSSTTTTTSDLLSLTQRLMWAASTLAISRENVCWTLLCRFFSSFVLWVYTHYTHTHTDFPPPTHKSQCPRNLENSSNLFLKVNVRPACHFEPRKKIQIVS